MERKVPIGKSGCKFVLFLFVFVCCFFDVNQLPRGGDVTRKEIIYKMNGVEWESDEGV